MRDAIAKIGKASALSMLLGGAPHMHAAQPAPAQAGNVAGPPQPQIVERQRCQPSQDPDELVVCGQNPRESPYRIPPELRATRDYDDRHTSWDTRTRDMESLERFSGQAIGLSSMLQHSRQVDCEWRAARQQMRGERPDCGAGRGF